MARLIDAEVVENWAKEMDRWLAHCTVMPGGNDVIESLERAIKDGDFDPPKFTAWAVDSVRRAIVDEQNTFGNPSDHEKLCDHLITYLNQLRESK